MINTFLKAKHWQIFLVLFGLPFLYQIFNMTMMIVSIANRNNPDVSGVISLFAFFPLIMIVVMAVFFGWFWSIAIGLQSKIPDTVKMKVGKFKVFFFIPLVYIISIMLFMGFMLSGFRTENQDSSPGMIFGIIAVVFPLHLFCMFCMFYLLYFVSKSIKTAELQRETQFSDFAGEFFLMWFYPIGIWILQPRINKLAEDGADLPTIN